MILFINACIRKESRTKRLAEALLEKLGGECEELDLSKDKFYPLDAAALEKRNELTAQKRLDDEMFEPARRFASADTVVIAAPYWDMSFPASLKAYIENICVMGIASCYDENGAPKGLCRAKKLYYVTTAGGKYFGEFSYEQIKSLAVFYFGIPEVKLIFAENLDIYGNDPEKILTDAINAIEI